MATPLLLISITAAVHY